MIAGERGVIPFSELETIASHIRDMGWHIEFLIWPERIVELEGRINRLPCPFVVDHLAFIDASAGVEQPAFQALLRMRFRFRAMATPASIAALGREAE